MSLASPMPDGADDTYARPDGAPVRSRGLAVLPAGDPGLAAQGWVRRFMADEARAQEATELYMSLGYEVRQEPLSPEEMDERCADCAPDVCRVYVLLYTRLKSGAEPGSGR